MATSLEPPYAVTAPMITPNTNKSSWATKDDWLKYQAVIRQLYGQQPLAEVMEFMSSRHGFRATEKMYKTRIKQWGLDKKNKEKEMRAIVRKKKQLRGHEQSTTFRIRGRPVQYKEVIRYWERKGVRIEDVVGQRGESKTPEAVDCFTPLRPPTMMPESMTNSERIFVSIRDYFKGCFETGTWFATDPRVSCQTTKVQEDAFASLNALTTKSETACVLFDNNRYQEAGQSLISAASEIKKILLAEHPMTLTYLLGLVAYTFQLRRHEIALTILRHFSALAKILIGDWHPLCCICGWLASIHPSQLEDVIARCSESTGDHFENLVGPLNRSTLVARLRFAQDQNPSRGAYLLQDLLHKYEATLGSLDIRTCLFRLVLAWDYSKNSDYAEAVRLGRGTCSRSHRPTGITMGST